jgi:uncharacterized protein YfbU (UPF0304 family)
MGTKSEIQKYMDENIKSIAVERHGNKFYGTLTDKDGRTFEFNKYVIDIERQFSNTHRTAHGANITEMMLLKYFQRLFVGVYASRRAFGNLEIGSTI